MFISIMYISMSKLTQKYAPRTTEKKKGIAIEGMNLESILL